MCSASVQKEFFGTTPDGRTVEICRLRNETISAEFLSYGAAIVSLCVPDRSGRADNVVLALPSLEDYVQNNRSSSPAFFGSIVGRYANRIAHARFSLDGREFQLPKNNGPNLLHGGPGGFYNVVWDAKLIENGIAFHCFSEDGDQGFPGNLKTTVRYILEGTDLRIQYEASTDQTTIINLTNHAYFNLGGTECRSVLDHQLKLYASRFTPVDATAIPTGELRSVANTPFDFRRPLSVGSRINESEQQLILGKGYDHNFVLDGSSFDLKFAAELCDPGSGRALEGLTTEPGIQFYSGNYLDGALRSKTGKPYFQHAGLCLETQHYPDSPNHPEFPCTVLHPGETFHSTTVYRFSVRA
jgi:aldose 1-epimerase